MAKTPFAPVVVLLVGMSALIWLSRVTSPSVIAYVFVLACSSAIVTFLLWRAPQMSARIVFAGAVLAHAITLAGQPAFENDYFRFLWDGWRTIESGTPYGIAPERYFADASVPARMTAVLDGINYPEFPTIYGPALQFAFAAAFGLAGSEVLGLQLLFAGANLMIIGLLLRRHAAGKVALYAWNPLIIAETSLHLHPDGLLAGALLTALLVARRRPVLAGVGLGIAAGVKLVALAAWPVLLRLRPAALFAAISTLGLLYAIFFFQGHGAGFESTATFATQWHFNPLLYEPLFQLLGGQMARLPALLIAGVLVLWLHARSQMIDDVPLAVIFGVILLFAPAVNSWYLLWLLPFAVGRNQIWPFAATAALPFSYLTGLNLSDAGLDAFQVHGLARFAEWSILWMAIVFDWQTHRHPKRAPEDPHIFPVASASIAVIMPALNEEASVGHVVRRLHEALPLGLSQVIVVDNGSTDQTARVAQDAGATVIAEPQRGYGAACLAGLAALTPEINIVLFIDSDGSDVVEDAPKILAPILGGHADLVIGSRSLGHLEPGAMTAPQRFGNWLAPFLIRIVWGVRVTDLGPFRAIRRTSLDALAMQDRDFGWTVEMQVRAAKLRLRMQEVPTDYRRRIGVSKISGTIDGVLKAGSKILFVIGREAFGDFDTANWHRTSGEPAPLRRRFKTGFNGKSN